ncbi:hypothetical protein FHX37_0830 [Haloactinospora alba]|uniref:Subtilisin inhibitor-like n=1 Tax=Haloactinospora alba TaxID=405555 RepID=A0A543NGK6_9ACTN|nr:hypothetical protein [Haloactinospora alba]TQN30941.1 hypothetical protein FHX37_0830 [Haloactinospora alba]
MFTLNLTRNVAGSRGTAVLGALCALGAVGYAFLVGGSLLTAPPEASGAEELTAASASDPTPEDAPTGQLRIQVSDQRVAYVQNLSCTGDTENDPDACAELAELTEHAQESSTGTQSLFEKAAESATCTQNEYGPQEAFITGTWEGEEVDTKVSRDDSCEEARWQRLRPITDRSERLS